MASNTSAAITERRVKHLRRLIFAQISMLQAIDGSKSAIDRNPPSHERLIIAAGVTTIYSSPFTEGQFLGALEPEFSQFSNGDLKKTHDNMLLFRNRLHAHRDLGVTGTNSRGQEMTLHKVFINIDPQLRITTEASYIQWEADNFQQAVELCLFQHSRLTEKANKLLREISRRSKRTPGRYILGETYPS